MAHFAKIGMNGKVIQVLTLDNKDMLNADGVEDESVGQQHLERHNNWPAQMWIQTSYNTSAGKHKSGDDSKAFRGNYAGIGMIYDEDNDLFISKKPHASWVLNTSEARWQSPVGDAPALSEEEEHTHFYKWNESTGAWDKVAK